MKGFSKNILIRLLFIATPLLLLLSGYIYDHPLDDDAKQKTVVKIKTVFLYNFAKNIEWPQGYKEGNFVIGVMGNNVALLSELNNLAQNKSIGTQPLEIKSYASVSNIGKCHMLYVLPENSSSLSELVGKLKGKSTLIVAEKPGSAKQGAVINFVIQDNKQKFELNKASAQKYNLKISNNLATLAIVVE